MDDTVKNSRLIQHVYDAALDPAAWAAFMRDMSSSLDAGFGLLWMQDFSDGTSAFEMSARNVSCMTGLDAAAIDQYKNYYAARNVWLPHASGLAEGSVTVSSALYSDELLKRTEFHGDFLRRHDLFYAVGSSIVKEGTRDVKMSFVRSERAGRFEDASLRRMQQMIPHIRNAVVLHRKLSGLKILADTAMAALELIPVGILLLTADGLLLHANQHAHRLVARTAALGIVSGGVIHTDSIRCNARLQQLIRDAVQTGLGQSAGHGGSMRLIGRGGELNLRVTPLPTSTLPFGENVVAAIFCSAPDSVIGLLSVALQGIYLMTPAEAHLTELLINGKSLAQVALARSVSIHTVRSQLKSVMIRTGAKTQADLVRIVLTGPVIASLKPAWGSGSSI